MGVPISDGETTETPGDQRSEVIIFGNSFPHRQN